MDWKLAEVRSAAVLPKGLVIVKTSEHDIEIRTPLRAGGGRIVASGQLFANIRGFVKMRPGELTQEGEIIRVTIGANVIEFPGDPPIEIAPPPPPSAAPPAAAPVSPAPPAAAVAAAPKPVEATTTPPRSDTPAGPTFVEAPATTASPADGVAGAPQT